MCFQTLKLLYGKILRDLKKFPEASTYRKHTEEIVNHRLGHVESVRFERMSKSRRDFHCWNRFQEPNIARLEKKINCGQIEEVIVQVRHETFSRKKSLGCCSLKFFKAENELMCVRRMALNNIWQPLIGRAPQNQWKWPIA